MKIVGAEGMTQEQVRMEIQTGAKFVVYHYCISLAVVTFKRSSPIHFIRRDGTGHAGWKYSLISLFLGWWGIPWGLIWTPSTIIANLRGGKDVTRSVLATVDAQAQPGQQPYVPGGMV